jgi:hypothetical protein
VKATWQKRLAPTVLYLPAQQWKRERQMSEPLDPSGEYETALDEALGEDPRSEELRQMAVLLRARRARLAADMDTADEAAEREKLRREIARLDEQIAVLGEEAGITKFVEDTVRVSLEMRRSSEG